MAYGGLLCSGQFDFPAWTAGPNLVHVLVCGGDILLFIGGWAAGLWDSVAGFRQAYDADPTLVYLTARTLIVLISLTMLPVTYRLGRRLYDRKVGQLSMVLVAFTYLLIRDSHFVVTDVLVALLLSAALLSFGLAIQQSSQSWLQVGALLSGLATGVKFTLGLSAIPMVLALGFIGQGAWGQGGRRWSSILKLWLPTFAFFAVGFVVGYPNLIKVVLKTSQFWQDFSSEWQAQQIRADLWQINSVGGPVFYAQALIKGMGLPMAILAVLGAFQGLWRRSHSDLLLLSFVVPFMGFLASRGYYTAHYAIPALPPLVVLGSRSLLSVSSRLGIADAWKDRLVGVVAVLILIPSVAASMRFDVLLTMTDTRTLAKNWIEANVPLGSMIGTSLYSAWEPSLSSPTNQFPESDRSYNLVTLGGLGGVSDLPFAEIPDQGVQYIILSSYVYDIPLRDESRQKARQTFFSDLHAHGELVYEVKPYSGQSPPAFDYDQVYGPWTHLWEIDRPGPRLEVYRLW